MIYFIHIDKCSGGSINNVLEKYFIMHKEYKHVHDAGLNPITKDKLGTNDKVVIFIRDPVLRFISCFKVITNKEKQQKINTHFGTLDLNTILDKARNNDTYFTFLLTMNYSFCNSFTRYLLTVENIQQIKPNIVFIGHSETICKDFIELKNKLGIPSDAILPHLHRTDRLGIPLSAENTEFIQTYYKSDYDILRELDPKFVDTILPKNSYFY